jgi:DME family drug/metabolite transporter
VRWPAIATFVAGDSMAAYQVCFFAGVAKTGVAIATMVAIGTAPILAGVLSFLVRGERLAGRWIMATALAVVGCSLLVAGSGHLSVDALGILLALAAGAAYATYAVASKGLLEERPPDAVMAVVFCLGALLLAPLLFVADLSWLAQPRGVAVALHLGLLATAAAYILFARGLMVIPVATAVTLSLAEPLTAGVLGVIVLGEKLTTLAVLGIALIFAGLVLLALSGRTWFGGKVIRKAHLCLPSK